MSEKQQLKQALLVSAALVVVLGAVAFWPRSTWETPPRPALKAPIVFDQLLTSPPPPSEPAPTSTQ
jgi:hypothetical protein